MAGAASLQANLPEIAGMLDVIDEIGRATLDAALIIHEYVSPAMKGKASIIGPYHFYPDQNNHSQAHFTHQRGQRNIQLPTCHLVSTNVKADAPI